MVQVAAVVHQEDADVLVSALRRRGFSAVVRTEPKDKLLPFKKGPFYLAMESAALVVPISIWGTEQMMTKGSLRIRPGTAHVAFQPPIDPAHFASRDELMRAVREAIASGLPEAMR